jgi:hypothetical protein
MGQTGIEARYFVTNVDLCASWRRDSTASGYAACALPSSVYVCGCNNGTFTLCLSGRFLLNIIARSPHPPPFAVVNRLHIIIVVAVVSVGYILYVRFRSTPLTLFHAFRKSVRRICCSPFDLGKNRAAPQAVQKILFPERSVCLLLLHNSAVHQNVTFISCVHI